MAPCKDDKPGRMLVAISATDIGSDAKVKLIPNLLRSWTAPGFPGSAYLKAGGQGLDLRHCNVPPAGARLLV